MVNEGYSMNNNPDENTQVSPTSPADASADPSAADEAGDALDLPARLKRAEA
jgi:hypothetical protein